MGNKAKEIKVLTGNTSRDIIRLINELNITKEDIVSLIYQDQYILFYYK